ncbi:hypothetical protein [uncultured Umboniibacter sp.]|uniref:hypothetical protein n=1 Tax=uncultured Umboniibacter sp. TaxID=1798917 RepID=UPI0026172B7F|nr:hypothetical protein [uncultured Umboniibacter sp.]
MKYLALGVFCLSAASPTFAATKWSTGIGATALYHSNNLATNTSGRVSLQGHVAMKTGIETTLGMGIELLPVGISENDFSEMLITWRVAEFTHSLSNRFAIRGYAGASRYEREATGLGYTVGFGVDYKLQRFSRWDIGAEVSFTSTDVSYDTEAMTGRSKFDDFSWASIVLRYRF